MTPRHILALVGSISLLAGATWVWRIDRLRERHLSDLVSCRERSAAQEEIFRDAQKAAHDLATAVAARKENDHELARRQSDAALADLRERYRTLVMRNAAAARGSPSGVALPENASTPQSPDGPGGDSGLPDGAIAITQSDALICADNTARLQTAKQWAQAVSEKP